jgi:hypothetical protein
MTEKTTDIETKDKEVVTEALRDGEAAAREFDKDRQRADQAEANFRKEKAKAEQATAQLAEMQAKQVDLQKKVNELTAGKDAEEAQILPDFDPENMSGDEVAAALPQVAKVVKALNAKIAKLEAQAQNIETDRQREREQTQAEQQKNELFQKVCTKLETKHGAGLRNRAIELMNQHIESEGAPATQAEGTLLLDECFEQAKKEAKDKPASKKKSDTPTDTGGGGARPTFRNVQIKKGSLEEVAAQYDRAAGTG